MLEQKVADAVEFFRGEPGFHRLFLLMKKKYQSLGRIGGTVKLDGFSFEEKEALGAFFGKDFHQESTPSVSLKMFAEQLEKTRFAGIPLVTLLENYFGEDITTNQEKRETDRKKKEEFFQNIIHQYPEQARLLSFIAESAPQNRFIHIAYSQDREHLETVLKNVCTALQHLPKKGDYERLSIFSQKVLKDPHAFDLHTFQGKVFLHALQFYSDQDYDLSSVEEVNELLQSFGILREDILNFVTCAGILTETEQGIHSVFASAVKTNTVLNVPLREILKLKRAYPAKGQTVFVVENSGVFSALLDLFPDAFPPLICTNGQFKLASLMLIDLIIQEGCQIYYSGDFDPEGLKMAQRLKERNQEHIHLWHFQLEDYLASSPEVLLSDDRVAKLETVTIEELQPIKEKMREIKKAGYQEEILKKLYEDICRHMWD